MSPTDANFVLSSWAAQLFSGQNCNNLNIKATTVVGYLKAAQDLLVQGGYTHAAGLPLDNTNNSMSENFIAKVKRWEALPNRRELISDDMMEAIYHRHLAASQDSLDDCLYDWIAVGRYAGFRASEWAQSRKLTYELIDSVDWREARAFIDADWLFYDQSGRLLDKLSPNNATRIHRVDIRWRVQKNANNGEIISFWRDNFTPRWCPVRAAWRICMRARRHGTPSHQPLGKYYDHKRREMVYINNTEVEAALRSVAKLTTGIKDDAVLNRMFGMHSIRVTACNELSRLKVSDSFIQRRLRWKSMTFLDYLRNNIYTAQRHNLSLTFTPSLEDSALQQDLRAHGHSRHY